MTQKQPITNYTNRDYSSLLASLLDQAALKLPEWTDRSENDPGRLLLESFAYIGDVLLYYQDRIANEAFLSTAVERRSVIDLLSLIGYTLATPAPATAELTVTEFPATADKVDIQVGARFSTKASPGKPSVEFLFLPEDESLRTMSRGDSDKTLTVTHATRITNETIGVSSGEANQSFFLIQRPILLSRDPNIETYLQVEVGIGGEFRLWQRRGTLLHSFSGDPHFLVKMNASDEATILFGDGQYGQIPPPGSTIRVTYLIGGGAAGNVGPNTITQVKLGVTPATIKVTNEKAASGGEDRESIENARRQAPGVYRSLQRAVTEADYVALAENFPGVAKAAAIAPIWNFVDIYVVSSGNLNVTRDLNARLKKYFDDKRMVTTIVNIREPVSVSIDITVAELGVELTFYSGDVKRRVEYAIADLFNIDQLEFGQPFYLSKIYEALENVSGVAFVREVSFRGIRSVPAGELVNSEEADKGLIQLRPHEFPRQGDLNLIKIKGGVE